MEPLETFPPTIESLSRGLPLLHSLELVFSGDVNKYERRQRGLESPAWRHKILDRVFGALAASLDATDLSPITILKIVNLSDLSVNKLVSSEPLRKAMETIKELHIGFCTDYDAQRRVLMPGFNSFTPHLRSRWLEPISHQLASLDLYSEENWGLVPIFDVKGLHFPLLRNLSLGSYTFAHKLAAFVVNFVRFSPVIDACGLSAGCGSRFQEKR